ncbi:T9SS type A sorting domain-containing protein [Ferruginibacter sp.]|nr:T9SS type A sorting domain-containing protein [Ferruginibacter sp.]
MQKFIMVLLCLLLADWLQAQDPAYPLAPVATGNIVKAEYFIDTDPGFNAGTDITVTAGVDITATNIPVITGALIAGVHRLYIRTLSAEGKWSITSTRQFVVDFDPAYPVATIAGNVLKAEYFVDTDPGFGNGVNVPLTAGLDITNVPASVTSGSLPAGVHQLYLRTLNAAGKWSISNFRQFVVDNDPAYPAVSAAVLNVIKAEYFVDADPGFGNGIDIPVTAATDLLNQNAPVNTNFLPAGVHGLYIRTLNAEGKWSLTATQSFIVNNDPAYPTTPALPGNVTIAEYFIDTDPGFGLGTPITLTAGVDVADINFSAVTGSLIAGVHNLYVRSKNTWSITNIIPFEVIATLPLNLLSFTGNKQSNNAILMWHTANEINIAHFEVQRSDDGQQFLPIGTVQPGRAAYYYSDANIFRDKQLLFYRLKSVDIDGRFTYSSVIRLRNNAEAGLTIYPNPVQNIIVISGLKQNTAIRIFSADGKLLQQLTAPAQTVTLDMSGYAKGMYVLQYLQGEEIVSRNIMKQ